MIIIIMINEITRVADDIDLKCITTTVVLFEKNKIILKVSSLLSMNDVM